MITLGSARDQKRVLDAIEEVEHDPYSPALKVRLNLLIGGEDFTTPATGITWGQTEVPFAMNASISGHLPRRLYDERSLLTTEVDGVEIPAFRGEKSYTESGSDPSSTNFKAASIGSLFSGADGVTVDEFLNYENAAPHSICFDMARRLPYDRNLISIEPIRDITLSYLGEYGFLAETLTGDVLSGLSMEETVGYQYRDTVYGGFIAEANRPISAGDAYIKTYSASQLPDWLSFPPAPTPERYSSVRLFATDPITSELLYEAYADVNYPPGLRQPHPHRTKHVAIQDNSANAFDTTQANARQYALTLARRTFKGTTILPTYSPLIERGDSFRVSELYRDKDGSYDVMWMMRITAFDHSYANSSGGAGKETGLLGTRASYNATILKESRIHVPNLIVPTIRYQGASGS